MTDPLIVGESNPYGNEDYLSLYPVPSNSAGGRLCRIILGMTPRQYLDSFERANLVVGDKWSAAAARERAQQLSRERPPTRIVLLGAKVCEAFGQQLGDFEWVVNAPTGHSFLRLPHPSGRCRVWNDPSALPRARGALRLFLPARVAVLIGTTTKEKKS